MANVPLPPVIFLMGPTASGKTALAVDLVARFPCEIISVDSATIFRDMDIGTAKPPPELLSVAPHRLIDFLDPGETYSAGRFRSDALREMADITRQGRIPLLVGGTLLYFRALEQGLATLPTSDPAVRERILHLAQTRGLPDLYRRLQEVDPVTARRVHPNDPQRLQRALEVYELTGRPLSAWLRDQEQMALPYRVHKVALYPGDRQVLHRQIAQRFGDMLNEGLIEEVARLKARGDLDPDLPSMRCVGYRQIWSFLDGRMDYDTMVERGIAATRQLAKRQLTWLRGLRDVPVFDPYRGAAEQVRELVEDFLS